LLPAGLLVKDNLITKLIFTKIVFHNFVSRFFWKFLEKFHFYMSKVGANYIHFPTRKDLEVVNLKHYFKYLQCIHTQKNKSVKINTFNASLLKNLFLKKSILYFCCNSKKCITVDTWFIHRMFISEISISTSLLDIFGIHGVLFFVSRLPKYF